MTWIISDFFKALIDNQLLYTVFKGLVGIFVKMHLDGVVCIPQAEYLPILQYVQEHYAGITMSALQNHFHYSDRHLNWIVKNCTGKTFSSLVLELRMENAKKLLLHKNGTTAIVAELVGYHDTNAFCRAFRSYTGITPRQWKFQNR